MQNQFTSLSETISNFWLSFDSNLSTDQWNWRWAFFRFSLWFRLRIILTLLFKISMLERMFDLLSMFWRIFLS